MPKYLTESLQFLFKKNIRYKIDFFGQIDQFSHDFFYKSCQGGLDVIGSGRVNTNIDCLLSSDFYYRVNKS